MQRKRAADLLAVASRFGSFPIILEAYREYIARAPEQLGAFPAFQIAPPLPFIPEGDHGKTFCILVCCWSGKPESAEKVFHLAPRDEDLLLPVAAL